MKALVQHALILTAGFGIGVLLFCNPPAQKETVMARVGEAVLTRSYLDERLADEGMRTDQENEFVERWVDRELLYQEAVKLNIGDDKALHWQLDLIEKEYRANALLVKIFAEKIQTTEEDIALYYEKNRELFQTDEDQVHLLDLLTQTREEAVAALSAIQAGRSFEDVAKQYSIGFFRERGGDMGYVKREHLIPELARPAFTLPEGKVSEIISTASGYHLLKITKKLTKLQVKPLADVRDEILSQIRVNRERVEYQDYLYRLRDRNKVFVAVPPSRDTQEKQE
jgi:peptidyl-prolyl cis-trans isomerase C